MRKLIWALGAAKFKLVTYWEKALLLTVPLVLFLSIISSAKASEPHVTTIIGHLMHH